jgi:hypothetical protein
MAEAVYSYAFALLMNVCLSAQCWKGFLNKDLVVMNGLSDEAKTGMREYN